MIEIDGSMGEGGGQILRTSLALSMCTGQPFRITGLRAKRPRPGLMRQHLTAVQAAQHICKAAVTGMEISSQELTFTPGKVQPGDYSFAIGTAGSATLVLQTVLPPLLIAGKPSRIHLEGGTHNPLSPPFHFVQATFLPVLEKMGARCEAQIDQWGFYPAGGGKMDVSIVPVIGSLMPVEICERGRFVRAEAFAGVSQIPWDIAQDECRLMEKEAGFPIEHLRPESVPSRGPGNIAWIDMQFENSRVMFAGFGELGVSRRRVALNVSRPAKQFYKAKAAAIDEHLADQLLIPMALAGGGRFTTLKPTLHTETNIQIIRRFLPVTIECLETRDVWEITVTRDGGSRKE